MQFHSAMRLKQMNLNEAYKIFELNPSCSDDEIKSKYRELTKKFHPDVNKEENATKKFQEINQAHDVLKNRNNQSNPLRDIFNKAYSQSYNKEPDNIVINQNITFLEAVKGTKLNINYKRLIQCTNCNGEGWVRDNQGKKCSDCKDTGYVVTRRTIHNSTVVNQSPCPKCYSKARITCNACSGSATVESETSILLKVPPGITNQAVMRLQGKGNYTSSGGFFNQPAYQDAFVMISYQNDTNYVLQEDGLVTKLKIPLIEALCGKTYSIDYIDGSKIDVVVPPLTKNFDYLEIPKAGVGEEDLTVIVSIEYPSQDKIDKMVEILNE